MGFSARSFCQYKINMKVHHKKRSEIESVRQSFIKRVTDTGRYTAKFLRVKREQNFSAISVKMSPRKNIFRVEGKLIKNKTYFTTVYVLKLA